MQDPYSIIHCLYEAFYRKVYGNSKYIFDPTEKMQKCISTFIELLDKKYKIESIGATFLSSYFIFQFGYWTELDLKVYNERITIPFIVGKKAFERWINRKQEFDWQLYNSNFLKIYKVNINEIIQKFKEEDTSILNRSEEKEKKRFYNTDRGALHCITNTTLYNHQSSLCLVCKNKNDCKTLLIDNYYQLALNRGYINNSKK